MTQIHSSACVEISLHKAAKLSLLINIFQWTIALFIIPRHQNWCLAVKRFWHGIKTCWATFIGLIGHLILILKSTNMQIVFCLCVRVDLLEWNALAGRTGRTDQGQWGEQDMSTEWLNRKTGCSWKQSGGESLQLDCRNIVNAYFPFMVRLRTSGRQEPITRAMLQA